MAAITAACIFSVFHTEMLPLLYHVHSASGFYLCCVEKMMIVVLVSQAFPPLCLYFYGPSSNLYFEVCVCVCVWVSMSV